MTFAVPMLLCIVLQLVFAYLNVFRGHSIDRHRKFGIVPVTTILACVFLGTVALWRCDVRPKRGAENIFFVWIGVGIMTLMIQSVRYASKGFVGLHMQYMAIAVCLVFSPGYNRIASILIRNYFWFREASYSHACWSANTWNDLGYYYTWSFLLGGCVVIMVWLLPMSPAKAPFFRIWSLGFWLSLVLACIMLACLYQVFVEFSWETYTKFAVGLNCSREVLDNWETFANAQRAEGLFAKSSAYGICTPDYPRDITGVPLSVAQQPILLRASGIWNVSV